MHARVQAAAVLAAIAMATACGLHASSADPIPGNGVLLNPYPASAIQGSDTPTPEPARPRRLLKTGEPAALPQVRAAYLIPSNRTAQTNGVAALRQMILLARDWFRDQLESHGFGAITFRYETEADGVTPRIQLVALGVTDSYLRDDLWGRTIAAATNAGLSIWASGEVWVLIPEAHVLNPNRTISGGVALGASFGSGTDPGVAMLGSDVLARFRSEYFADDRAYDGMVLPDLGVHSLKQDVTFPWYEGTTLSSISSAAKGTMLHEFGHALGLPHDLRNDDNCHGNLMGNGLRGVRGCVFPARYTNDYTHLTLAASRVVSVNRYFGTPGTDELKPGVIPVTTGAVTPSNGQIRIQFKAGDAGGLSGAQLTLNGELLADMPLTGTNCNTCFWIPNYTPGTPSTFQISVWDLQGNRSNATTTVTPTTGGNRGPIPKFKITRPVGLPGQTAVLDASHSTDPDDATSDLTVEWDLDGDGIFDTAPSTVKTLTLPRSEPGTWPVRVRVRDPDAAQSLSAPLVLLTHCPALGASTDTRARIEWLSKLGFLYHIGRSSNLFAWCEAPGCAVAGDGGPQTFDADLCVTPAAFYRLTVSLRDTP